MIAGMNEPEKSLSSTDIDELEQLYRKGDYKLARRLLKKLGHEGEMTAADRARIEPIERSMKTDTGAIAAFVFTLLVLIFLTATFGL